MMLLLLISRKGSRRGKPDYSSETILAQMFEMTRYLYDISHNRVADTAVILIRDDSVVQR